MMQVTAALSGWTNMENEGLSVIHGAKSPLTRRRGFPDFVIQAPLTEMPDHLASLCAELELGAPVGELDRVLGGFHHRVWRLDTRTGVYAIKQLSPEIDLGEPANIDHFNVTEAVAEGFANRGITAIHALNRDSDYLQVLDGVGYLTYPWTDALAIDRKHLSVQHALEVARVLARMHRADLQLTGVTEAEVEHHPEDKITLLVNRAVACNARDYQVLEQELPSFLGIAASQEAARQVLAQYSVISHGDLDQKNVLWNAAGEPVLIDWESARRLNPGYETVLVALDWSGITSAFEYPLFEKFLAAYQLAGGEIHTDTLPAVFDCILGDWLNWLMFNVGRSIDLEDAGQRSQGAEQVDLALSTILRLERLLPRLVSRLEQRLVAAC